MTLVLPDIWNFILNPLEFYFILYLEEILLFILLSQFKLDFTLLSQISTGSQLITTLNTQLTRQAKL